MTDHPTITRSDVDAAARRIDGRVRRTPVLPADDGEFGSESPSERSSPGFTWFKLEQLQHTGSFKARGAFNRVLAAAEGGRLTDAGVVAASGGNAGLAVAHAAATQGVPARVYVPETAPAVKLAKLAELGATVVTVGSKYADAYRVAVEHTADTGALFCHAYDQPEICAGQGTLGREFTDQVAGGLDTVLVAVGGGRLMAGVAAALEGEADVVAIEPATIPTLHTALRHGGPVDVDVSGVAADSLGATHIGEIAFDVARRTGVRSVLVDDADVVTARARLWKRYRVAVEHGTAAAYAALLSSAYRPDRGERVGVVLCGGNTDPADLA